MCVFILGSKLGFLRGGVAGSMTSGLVGEMQLQALPSVSPLVTMVATLLAMLVSHIGWSDVTIDFKLFLVLLCDSLKTF